jgi:ABC-type dipeptide/oligopeptide/nickel transport system permease component
MSMMQYVVRRILLSVPTLLGLTVVTFVLANYLPGDPLVRLLGERGAANPEIVAAYTKRWGLDKSGVERYFLYMRNLLHGDLGRSTTTQRAVSKDLASFFPATIELALAAVTVAAIGGILAGILAARYKNRWPDAGVRAVALVGSGVPVFWLGLLALEVFYLKLHWVPGPEGRLSSRTPVPPHTTGMYTFDALVHGQWATLWDAMRHLMLPAIVLGAYFLGLIARMVRASLLEIGASNYLVAARARGMSERRIMFVHALPNALIPVITVLGLAVGGLLAGAVLTETVFAWPGIGRYAVDTAKGLDYQAVLGVTILIGFVYVIANIVVDVLYAALDPRIRMGQ